MADTQAGRSAIIGEGRQGLVIAQPLSQNPATEQFGPTYSILEAHSLELKSLGGIPGWSAVKIVSAPPSGRSRPLIPHDVLKEAKIMQRLSHPGVAKVLAYEYDTSLLDHRLYLPLYVCSLSSLFTNPSFPSLSSRRDVQASISYQLLSALSYLHSAKEIAHRDLNPSNLLLDTHGNFRLVDFGTAWVSPTLYTAYGLDFEDDSEETEEAMCPDVGSGAYRSPELLFSPLRYDPFAVDIWAAGCIIAQLFRPFSQVYPIPPDEDSGDEEADANSDSDYDPLEDERPSLPAGSGTRQPLFDARYGALGLAASIFKIRGTPTDHTWPSFKNLPDANKIEFPPSPSQALASNNVLSELGETDSRTVVELLEGLLQLDPAGRLKAEQALRSEWFSLAKGRWEIEHSETGGVMEWYERLCVDWVHGNLDR
ncbi:hypothetical protein IAR50_005274 [Cryptococcus sp. DSM 104548]